jgi:riboflavin kinase/FMN adenylyltransferase
MIVATSVSELAPALEHTCVTIGNFDGVHLGHQKLISRVKARAQALHLLSVVVTFDPHPLRVLVGDRTPPFITTLAQKLDFIATLGVEVTLVIPFTRELAALDPEQFVQTYLVDGLHTRELIIGYDYSFGKGRRGNYELLKQLGTVHGFGVERLDPVIIDGAIVSSTRIRDLVQAGKVWEAKPLLGRFHQAAGTVVPGRSRGRLLGFPTANLQLAGGLSPKTGVYAVWADLDGAVRQGVANIGHNPTFGHEALSVEVHLLDFQGDLYGRELRVQFVQRIRSERKFESVAALVARIGEDVALARQILAAPEAQP